mgnify:CR=1 FL=1
MGRKKCHDIQELTLRYKNKLKKRKPDYELVGEYNDKVVDIKHVHCGHTFSLNPKYFLYHGECRFCNKEARDKKKKLKENKKIERFKEDVKLLGNGEYIVIGTSIDVRTRKITIKHNCGYEYGIRMCMFRKGRRCPICTKTKFKTPEMYRNEFDAVSNGRFKIITPYEKSTKKIKVYHNKCNQAFDIIPGQFLKDPRCSVCEKTKK